MMDGHEKSDSSVVSEKLENEIWLQRQTEDPVEKRGLTKGNPTQQTNCRTQSREKLSHVLERIRQAVRKDRKQRLTNLWHHVCDVDRLREVYYEINRRAAAGIDEQSWHDYGMKLEVNLSKLAERLHRGSYHPSPAKRHYIPKADGSRRPIAIPVIEDKIVQRAATQVLGSVYECHFKGFSYGFRPGRSQHRALDAVYLGLMKRKVNWVLDADIRGCFDAIDHDWMIRFTEHLISDKRLLRQLSKWLKAGVMEDGAHQRPQAGTPQGGSLAPRTQRATFTGAN